MPRVRVLPPVLAVLAALALFAVGAPRGVQPAQAATCASHATQAEAQAAKDTRDGDGDGIYCESLPCPCAGPTAGGSSTSGTSTGASKPTPPSPSPASEGTSADPKGCRIVAHVVDVGLSSTKYPQIRAHWDHAIAEGYPKVLTIHRKGAEERRAKLLAGIGTAPGEDRDEYPMAMARSSVKADVRLVDSSENRSSGSVQGIKLRRYCSGQRFEIVWY